MIKKAKIHSNRLKRKRMYIYERILVFFILLLAPSFFVGTQMSDYGSTFIKSRILESVNSNILFYTHTLNNQINQLRMEQSDLINNYDLQRIAVMTSIEKYEQLGRMNALIRYLFSIKSSTEIIDEIGVYVRSLGRMFSSNNKIEKIPNEQYMILKEYFSSGEYGNEIYYAENGDIYNINTFNYKKVDDVDKTLYTIYAKISKKYLNQIIDSIGKYNDAAVFAMDKNFNLLAASNPSGENMDEIILKLREEKGGIGKETTLKIGNNKVWITYGEVASMGMRVYIYLPYSQVFGELEKFGLFFKLLSLFSLIGIIVFTFLINITIHRPFKKLMNAIDGLKLGNMNETVNYDYKNDEFGYIYKNFNSMVLMLNEYINQVYEQKIISQQLELKQLQSQINPHFLYNSFYNVYMLCKSEDYETLSIFTQRLGSYFEYITRSGVDEVRLVHEYNHVRSYLEIQAIRFVNRINISISELPKGCEDKTVPKLILQPVVENVFEHGFSSKISGDIKIEMEYSDLKFIFRVEDNGHGISGEKLLELKEKLAHPENCVEKTGIINVARRIRLKYGKNSGLSLERSQLGGAVCTLVIEFS